jgi:hypothetical protein
MRCPHCGAQMTAEEAPHHVCATARALSNPDLVDAQAPPSPTGREPGHQEETNMYCTQCGTELPVEAAFCEQCGTPVTEIPSPSPVAGGQSDRPDAKAREKERSMSKKDRIQFYSDFLRKEGYAPEIDKEGDIIFKCEGRTYYIILSEEDAEYFQLVFPNFWSIENETERARAEKAAASASVETKVAKVFLVRDNTWATLELFCADPDHVKPVFRRSMAALQTAVGKFAEKMRAST